MTVEELIAELGVTVDPAKAGVLKTWNDKFSAMETDSQTKLADAQKQLQDAQAGALGDQVADGISAHGAAP